MVTWRDRQSPRVPTGALPPRQAPGPLTLTPSQTPPRLPFPGRAGRLPSPHRPGAAAPVAQMCRAARRPPGGGLRWGEVPPPPWSARALSCHNPPPTLPEPAAGRAPAPSCSLSQLSLGWGWAAGEQLQGREQGLQLPEASRLGVSWSGGKARGSRLLRPSSRSI